MYWAHKQSPCCQGLLVLGFHFPHLFLWFNRKKMSWFPHYASSPLEFIWIVCLLPLAFCPSWNPIVPDVRAMQPERNYQIPAAGSSTCLLFCSACASEGKSQGNCWLARDYSRFPFFFWSGFSRGWSEDGIDCLPSTSWLSYVWGKLGLEVSGSCCEE